MNPEAAASGIAEGDFVMRLGDPSRSLYTVDEVLGDRVRMSADHGDSAIISRADLAKAFTKPTRLTFRDDRPHMVELMGGEEAVTVIFARYRKNDALAITLESADGQAYATASVNRPEVPVEPFHAFIKDYTENAGMVDLLVRNGILEPAPTTTGAHALTPVAALVAMLQQQGDLPRTARRAEKVRA